MVRHIVFWKTKDEHEGMDGAQIAAEIQSRVLAMKGRVPALQDIECGIDFDRSERAWDVALCATFATRADLDAYQADPVHGDVKNFVRAVVAQQAVVDYEL